MREFSVPPAVEIPDTATLTDTIFEGAADRPSAVLLSRKVDGAWRDVTSSQFRNDVVGLAKGLIASGIEPGDRIGLMSRTRYEWTLCDYAIWAGGAVTVPIYDTSSAEQVAWILGDSEAKAVFVETADHEETLREVSDQLPTLKSVWRIEGGAVDEVSAAGAGLPDEAVDERRHAVGADSLATIVYTSGTTGRPKGCELTHRNLLFDARASDAGGLDSLFDLEDASTLLFLPLAHSFARMIQIGSLEAGVRLGHSANIKDLLPDLEAFKPRFILSVPRVFEKVYNSAEQKATTEGRGRIFRMAADTAVAYSRALDAGGPGVVLRARHALFDRLVYGKLRAALGGNVQYAVSGGAPLGVRLGHFFRGIGVTVLEGYGLTETSPATNVNVPGALKIGTVGRPFPGTTIRIADDGEILVKGEQVFRGYWRNPQATAEILDPDGWLRTGDIGELDGEGFLRITGRKKELIVTASGKNVAPAVLEDGVRAHPLVSQCLVVGDQRPYVAALVTLDAEALAGWQKQHGKQEDPARLRDDPDIVSEIQDAVDDANKAVSRAESIRRFRILAGDFTEESGHLTPTLKVKRHVVLRDYADEVEAVYSLCEPRGRRP
ncbi:MAG: AMP-dependent synthetase/ligase [Streptosporangiaceae bacterium]